jgi:hypothetical protein
LLYSEIEPRLVKRIVGCNSPHCDAFMGYVHRNEAYSFRRRPFRTCSDDRDQSVMWTGVRFLIIERPRDTNSEFFSRSSS